MGKKSRIKAQRAAQAPKSAEDLVNQLLDIDREQKSLQAQIDQLHALKRGQYTKMLAPRPDRQSFTLDQILTPEQIESCIQILNAEPDAGQQHRKIEGYLSPFAQQINAKGTSGALPGARFGGHGRPVAQSAPAPESEQLNLEGHKLVVLRSEGHGQLGAGAWLLYLPRLKFPTNYRDSRPHRGYASLQPQRQQCQRFHHNLRRQRSLVLCLELFQHFRQELHSSYLTRL
jgi:hypothetical protein